MDNNKSKNYKYCLVPQCQNTTCRTPNKIFISLPKDRDRRIKWLQACRGDKNNISDKSKIHVCEEHFNLEDDMENYLRFKLMGGPKIMKPDVVPHIFNYQAKRKRGFSRNPMSVDLKRVKNQLIENAESSTVKDAVAFSSTLSVNDFEIKQSDTNNIIECDNFLINVCQKEDVSTQTHPKGRNKYIQCNLHDGVKVILSPMEIRNKELETSQIQTFSQKTDFEEKEFKRLSLKCTILKLQKRPNLYMGLPDYAFYTFQLLIKYCKLKSLYIFLTLKKIKTGHSFMTLADDFGTTPSNASRIFAKTVPLISKYIGTCIIKPESNSVKANSPLAFQSQYSNVFCIINCIEIEIERPSDPIKRSLTWSDYKKCYTFKYLISCTPDTIINFISTAFGGKTSDEVILKYSGFLDLLPFKVTIMTDSGFKNIENLLITKGCRLIRPPNVPSNFKLTKTKVLEVTQIEILRQHVERVIYRLREFVYLAAHSPIDKKLIGYTDHIMKIACGLINLQTG